MLPPFSIQRPGSLVAALELVDDDRIPYWGGTELLLAMEMGLLRPDVLVDLKSVEELRGIGLDGADLVIGAGTTHAEIARSGVVSEHAGLLATASAKVGNARVRAQGTIGGNLCFAEPRSDVATVLMALEGRVRLATGSGTRTMSVEEFVLGPYWTAREPHEVLVDVRVPLPTPDVGVYLKFQPAERPTVSIAAVRRGIGARVVIGAVAEVPLVVHVADLAQVDVPGIVAGVEPVEDLTGAADYKLHVTEVYVRRALEGLRG
jgi:aerobic carbon-monoxide dehydrogenase medium subunit